MTQNLIIDIATDADTASLHALLREQLNEEKALFGNPKLLNHNNTSDATISRLLRHWINQTAIGIFVARDEETKPLGFVTCQVKPDFYNNLEVLSGEVVAIFVDEAYRGKKIATALLQQAEIWFREKQVHAINVSWLVDNGASRSLYASFGFSPVHTTGRKLL